MRDASSAQIFGPRKTANCVSGIILCFVGLLFLALGVLSVAVAANPNMGWVFAGVGLLGIAHGAWLVANASRFWVSLDDANVTIATGSRRKIIPYELLSDVARGVDDVLLIYRTGGNYAILDFYFSGNNERDAFIGALSSKLSESSAARA